ncbi:MAG: hypothetical protein OHK0013_38060 [Sandaracinaceae bacterium]
MSSVQPSEGDYAEAARRALARGEVALALEQIGAALSFDPTATQHLETLERALERCPRPLDLLPGSGAAFFGAAAVRAYVLHRLGRLDEALLQLLDVVRFRPEAPYLRWVDAWVRRPRDLKGVSTDALTRSALHFLASTGRTNRSADVRPNLDALDRLLDLLQRRGPRVPPELELARAIVLRRLGRSREALDRLRSRGGATTVELLAELAYASVECGLDGSPALRRATELDPGRVDTWLDLGDCELDAGHLRRAAEAYERVLTLGPAPQKAEHASHALAYVRFRLGGCTEPPRRVELGEAAPILAALVDRSADYLTRLPPPADPLASVVSDFVRRASASTGQARMRIRRATPSLGSARCAVRRALAARGVAADVVVMEGPAPEPLDDVWDGAADPELTREASLLRREPFDLPRLLDPTAGPALSVGDAVRLYDAFDGDSDDPVAALDHHRLAVLVRLARAVKAEAGPELEHLIELARSDDPWSARVAWLVWGGLCARHLGCTRLLDESRRSVVDARTPSRLCALLRCPTLDLELREATYVELRAWERAKAGSNSAAA